MKRRKPHKPVGSPLRYFVALETERINHLLTLAGVPYRLTDETCFALLCSCDWKCQDTGVFYAAEPLHIVWIDPIADYGLTDNLRVVAASQEHYYLSWDVLHKRSWAQVA